MTFRLIKGKSITWSRIESADDTMVVGSARPLEDAARIAYAELVGWLEDSFAFDRWDAYQYISQCGRMYVGNIVDTNYSVVGMVCKPGPLPEPIEGLSPWEAATRPPRPDPYPAARRAGQPESR